MNSRDAGRRLVVFLGAVLVSAWSVATAAPLALFGTPQQVAGTWVLSVELENGQGGDATFVLAVDDDLILGTYSGALGTELRVRGRVTDEGVEFSFDSQVGLVSFRGTVDGDSMEGTCEYGQLGPGTFKGERRH